MNVRRVARTRQLRFVMNILSVFNLFVAFGWAYVRTFYCWDADFCDPVEGLISSWGCLVCQADVLMMVLLFISTISLVTMLVILFRHEIYDEPGHVDVSAQRSTFLPIRTAQSVQASARNMGADGPGIFTTIFALLAILVGIFYIFSENKSLTVLWW